MIRWISSLFFSEIGSLGRGMDLEKEVSPVLLQFGFLRVFPVHVQEAGRYVGLKLEGEQRQSLGEYLHMYSGQKKYSK